MVATRDHVQDRPKPPSENYCFKLENGGVAIAHDDGRLLVAMLVAGCNSHMPVDPYCNRNRPYRGEFSLDRSMLAPALASSQAFANATALNLLVNWGVRHQAISRCYILQNISQNPLTRCLSGVWRATYSVDEPNVRTLIFFPPLLASLPRLHWLYYMDLRGAIFLCHNATTLRSTICARYTINLGVSPHVMPQSGIDSSSARFPRWSSTLDLRGGRKKIDNEEKWISS